MTANLTAAVLLAILTLYATLGGADFGAGLWDLLAGPSADGARARALIREAVTPVWESNHVWLVFALVVFFTGFPTASAAVWTYDAVPLWLAAGGIVLRGAAFAFGPEATKGRRALGSVFALSSLITPFFMGTVVGAMATVPGPGTAPAWTGLLPVACGLLFVGACAYLAAVYLTHEAGRRGDDNLWQYFARRGRLSGLVTGVLALIALAVTHHADRRLWDGLTGRALPLVVGSGVCGVLVMALLRRRYLRDARPVAWLGVAAVAWAWGVGQYPVLLPATGATIGGAAAPGPTLATLLWVAVVAVILIVPCFLLLFSLHGKRLLVEGEGTESEHQNQHRTIQRLSEGIRLPFRGKQQELLWVPETYATRRYSWMTPPARSCRWARK
jgi:cytochrome bd ubiquinol oxidase subunit II